MDKKKKILFSLSSALLIAPLLASCGGGDSSSSISSKSDDSASSSIVSSSSVPSTYTINYVLNGGTNDKNNPKSYTEGKAVTFKEPVRDGYTFDGWYSDSSFTTKVTGVKTGTTGNITVYAKWTIIEYTISYELNGGTNDVSNPTKYTIETETLALNNATKTGYDFLGWYEDSQFASVVDSIEKGSTGDITLYAKFNPTVYHINYELDGGNNNAANPATYTIESNEITLLAPTKRGYTFDGWYSDSDYSTAFTKIAAHSTTDITVYAKWTALPSFYVTVASSDSSKGSVTSSTDGAVYTGENATVTATANEGYEFKGWYNGDTLVSTANPYAFTIAEANVSLTAKFDWTAASKSALGIEPTINGTKTAKYGLYPQTHVTDTSIIQTLNGLPESDGWYRIGATYYAKTVAAPVASTYTFSDGSSIESGKTYWFKCEPIAWDICNDYNNTPKGEYRLLSTYVLDAHAFDSATEKTYKDSNIRSWLTNDFYNSAFSLGDAYGKVTSVANDNDSACFSDSFSYQYKTDAVQDKVYLLSYKDLTKDTYIIGGSQSPNAKSKVTDYAKARGAFASSDGYGRYWTRTPFKANAGVDNGKYCIRYGGEDGAFKNTTNPSDASIGIRPMMTIKKQRTSIRI